MTSTRTTTLTVGSALLGSTRPDELRAWYGKVLAPHHHGDGPIRFGDFGLVIDGRDDIAATTQEPGRFVLNFHVDDIDAVDAQLRAAEVEWLVPIEERPFARVGTFVDPDGNYRQVIQLNPDYDHS